MPFEGYLPKNNINHKKVVQRNDLLQKHLAEYLHCTQVAYSRYELGTRDIPTQVLIELAAFYKTSTDYILGITDIKNPYLKK